ncbi:MAG TPA: GH92 family glycosyl hydrolase [Candidatus Hydrogenedentes bacterium]|nr:MAG: Glycosyl hydrolase family 92 [Candidatus Hydrogenedentes bacterium ADurb.Bin170]HNZ47708.1 GH92 family glycosyl hydrolase [Candidatus Hydrogenedentota bacterium]HOD95335.1 GH92 family glycosyl hydrolase [Candidatus Hydrogenedentota bacterium]HOR50913.1 GH92 family glycosyl hydrolase [Candidatus Hydrogenedentota bacterium]HPK24604.1 GH92 family glycosyl hydrolase [Candidatus Hydrogenedentota bacterium]
MKKWIRRLAVLLLALLLIPLAALSFIVLTYYRVVRAQPGSLPVPVYAGPLGSQVNVFSGTGGYPWLCPHNSPAATVPFGMVRLAPDTASLFIKKPALNLSGYYYGDNKILGFSHTRLMGAGVVEGGNFRILPTRKERMTGGQHPVMTRFSHTYETAFPGYYAVRLPEEDILVELTATGHTGIHRYTFPPSVPPQILFEATSALGKGKCRESHCRLLPDSGEIEASIRYYGGFSSRYDGLDLFCVLRFSRPFQSAALWNGDALYEGGFSVSGENTGACLNFSAGEPVEVRLGLSSVSVANARMNLDEEAGTLSFEEIYDRARNAWEERFGAIRVAGGTESDRRIFFTALYRTFQLPTQFSDVNGDYRGFDKEIHRSEGRPYFTDMSLWDTFRSVHPLYNLIARDEQNSMIRSLIEMAKIGGSLPRWPAGCGYSGSMFGTPADMMITEAWLKGVRDYDIETAWFYMRRSALEGPPVDVRCARRNGLEYYLKYGYCPDDLMKGSVANTLEFCWADYSLSLLAASLGKQNDAELLGRHARFYRNLWNPETGYFQPKDSAGTFSSNFKPDILTYIDFKEEYTRAFVEGSAMQWRWGVPFDGDDLVRLLGGAESFVKELEKYMEGVNPKLGDWNPGPYYWHGNEPYFHAPYLFLHAGRSDLTQKWVRWILKNKYADNYVGLEGNDDCGTLSAWYVLSALGLYPVAGTDRYWIGSPLFDRADLRLDEGRVLTITAENNTPENCYVKALYLNDEPHSIDFLYHHEIENGGSLRFVMSPTPAE